MLGDGIGVGDIEEIGVESTSDETHPTMSKRIAPMKIVSASNFN
jgi:hypothetical protein